MRYRPALWFILAALLAAGLGLSYLTTSVAYDAGCTPATPTGRIWHCPTPGVTP